MKLAEYKPRGIAFRPAGVDRANSRKRGVGRRSRAGSFEMFKGVVKPKMAGNRETNLDTKSTMARDRREFAKAMDEARNGKKEELPPVGTRKEFPKGIYEVAQTISGKKRWVFVSNPNGNIGGVHAPLFSL